MSIRGLPRIPSLHPYGRFDNSTTQEINRSYIEEAGDKGGPSPLHSNPRRTLLRLLQTTLFIDEPEHFLRLTGICQGSLIPKFQIDIVCIPAWLLRRPIWRHFGPFLVDNV
jgi:hypothetical protein